MPDFPFSDALPESIEVQQEPYLRAPSKRALYLVIGFAVVMVVTLLFLLIFSDVSPTKEENEPEKPLHQPENKNPSQRGVPAKTGGSNSVQQVETNSSETSR